MMESQVKMGVVSVGRVEQGKMDGGGRTGRAVRKHCGPQLT